MIGNGYSTRIARRHADPLSVQAAKLDELSERAGKMPGVFQAAQQNRDQYQKRLNDMVEDALKQIAKTRTVVKRKAQSVADSTKSHAAKMDHDLSCMREDIRKDLEVRTEKVEEAVSILEGRMTKLEADLRKQARFRKAHVEETLGPIRDEVLRLTAALEAERRARCRQEADREKMLEDEVRAFRDDLDAEKFERLRQLSEFDAWVSSEGDALGKKLYKVDRESQDAAASFTHDLHGCTTKRIAVEHAVIESIASFVKRYHVNLAREVGMSSSRVED